MNKLLELYNLILSRKIRVRTEVIKMLHYNGFDLMVGILVLIYFFNSHLGKHTEVI